MDFQVRKKELSLEKGNDQLPTSIMKTITYYELKLNKITIFSAASNV